MGQVYHSNARTTQAVRRAIQHRQESLQSIATRYRNQSKNGDQVAQAAHGPRRSDGARTGPNGTHDRAGSHCRSLSSAHAAAARRLPVCAPSHHPAALPFGPAPLFSAPRHQPPPLSEAGQSPPKKKFKDYPIGYLHVNFAEVQTEEGKQHLFVAIDRTRQGGFAEQHPHAKRVVATEFLRRVLDKLPDKVPAVLTDNGVQFTPQAHQFLPCGHRFDRICREHGVEHPADQVDPSLDQRPRRTHEPHH